LNRLGKNIKLLRAEHYKQLRGECYQVLRGLINTKKMRHRVYAARKGRSINACNTLVEKTQETRKAYMYNLILKCVRLAIVAVESIKY